MSERRFSPATEFVYWLVFNVAVAAASYAAFVLAIDGALNLMQFFAWFVSLPVSVMGLSATVQRHVAATPPTPIRSAIARLHGWAILIAFVWTGHVITAAAWAVAMVCGAISSSCVADLRAAAASKKAV